MNTNLFSIADAARLLKIDEHRIAYAHRVRGLPDATHKVAGKRIYNEADLYRLAEYFGIALDLAGARKEADHE